MAMCRCRRDGLVLRRPPTERLAVKLAATERQIVYRESKQMRRVAEWAALEREAVRRYQNNQERLNPGA